MTVRTSAQDWAALFVVVASRVMWKLATAPLPTAVFGSYSTLG